MPAVIQVRWSRGATLPELLVALVLAGVAGALGAGLLTGAERRVRRDLGDDRASQAARDVAHILGAELAPARLVNPGAIGDTAVDVEAHVAASVACVAAAGIIVLPAERTSLLAPFTLLRVPPEPGDVVLVWDGAAAAWHAAVADSVHVRPDGAGCPASGTFRSVADSVAREPTFRIRVSPPVPPTVIVGAPVRILRRGRWAIYRAADRAWWLGYRRCGGGACGAVQPVAGPLAAPPDSGLMVRANGDGTVAVIVTPQVADLAAARTRRHLIAVRGAP